MNVGWWPVLGDVFCRMVYAGGQESTTVREPGERKRGRACRAQSPVARQDVVTDDGWGKGKGGWRDSLVVARMRGEPWGGEGCNRPKEKRKKIKAARVKGREGRCGWRSRMFL